MRSWRWLVVAVVLSPALLLAGPASPGFAAATVITLPPPIPLAAAPGVVSAGTAATIGSSAATAANAGATVTSTISMGGTAASGGTAAAASTAIAPIAVVAAGAAIGYGTGTFVASTACAGGVELLCMPTRTDGVFIANSDLGAAPSPGWAPLSTWSSGVSLNGGTSYTPPPAVPVSVTPPATLPTYNQTGGSLGSWTVHWSGTNTYSNNARVSQAVAVRCRNLTTGVQTTTYTNQGFGLFTALGSAWPSEVRSGMTPCPAGTGLKKIEWGYYNQTAGAPVYTTAWHPVGSPDYPTWDGNPIRTWLTRGQCVHPVTAASSFVTASSVSWQETDVKIPKYPDVTCPSGRQLVELEVHKMTPSIDAPGDDVLVWEWVNPTDPTDYPNCGGPTACLLKLFRVQSDGSLADCFASYAEGLCSGWLANQTDYECHYGPYTVAISDCYAYGPSFGTGTSTQTQSQIDPGTKTRTVPETDNCAQAGLAEVPCYGDPATGQPTGGTGTETDTGTSSCPPDAGFLSFLNPFWLFSTLKCAFVPSQAGLRAAWDAGNVDWCQTAPGVLMCAAGAYLAPLGDIGDGADPEDCEGGTIDVPVLDPRTAGEDDPIPIKPFETCMVQDAADLWLDLSGFLIYAGSFFLGAKILGKSIGASDGVGAQS